MFDVLFVDDGVVILVLGIEIDDWLVWLCVGEVVSIVLLIVMVMGLVCCLIIELLEIVKICDVVCVEVFGVGGYF